VFTVYVTIKKQGTHSRVLGTLENKTTQLSCSVLLAPPLHVYISATNRPTESHTNVPNFTIFRRFWVARTGFIFRKIWNHQVKWTYSSSEVLTFVKDQTAHQWISSLELCYLVVNILTMN